MQNVKKYLRGIIFNLVFVLLYFGLLVILHYTGLLKLSSISKVNFVFVAIYSLVMGFLLGKKASKKGYLEGLKLGLIIIAILFIFNLIFYRSASLYLIVYYAVILSSTTIGSMIGINTKH